MLHSHEYRVDMNEVPLPVFPPTILILLSEYLVSNVYKSCRVNGLNQMLFDWFTVDTS